MKLYVFRHGESVGNQQRLFSGWSQMPLTDQGRRQALALREKVKGLSFDLVFSSDLRRAMQTAQLVLPGRELTLDPDLREVDVGSLMEQGVDAATRQYGDQLLYSRRTRDFTFFGGENGEALRARAESFLQRVSRLDAQQVAVFTHEGLMKGLLSAVLFPAWIPDPRVKHHNCAYSVFTYSPDQGWGLLKWNNA